MILSMGSQDLIRDFKNLICGYSESLTYANYVLQTEAKDFEYVKYFYLKISTEYFHIFTKEKYTSYLQKCVVSQKAYLNMFRFLEKPCPLATP